MGKKRTSRPEESATVTAIEPLASDPTRRKIMLGRKVAATLADHEVERLGIQIGTRWTTALAGRVEQAVAMNKARVKALDILGRRACTHGEMVSRLTRAKCESAIARAVADELVEQGWIDDAQVAGDAAKMMTRRMVSLEAIAAKLKARHVNEGVAEDAAAEALAEVDRTAAAAAFIKQKLSGKRGKFSERDVQRIVAGLSRRGFSADDVKSAFRSLGVDLGGMLDNWDD